MPVEKQRVFRIYENRWVKRTYLIKLGQYLRSKDNLEAWYLIREYLQKVKGFNGLNWQFVDERFAMPMSPYKPENLSEKDIKELTDQNKVADESCNLTRAQNDVNAHKTHYYDLLGLAAVGAVFAVIIFAMLAMSGNFNLGRLFGGGG